MSDAHNRGPAAYVPPPKFATVLRLVEEHVTGEGSEEIWRMRWALAEKLPGAKDQRPGYSGNLTSSFCAQVLRAADQLASDGKLIIFWTPGAWENQQKLGAEAAQHAREAEEHRAAIKTRIGFFGFDIDEMDTEAWEHLADLLDELGRSKNTP